MKLKWRKKNYCLFATGKSGLFYYISATDRGGCHVTIEWRNSGMTFPDRWGETSFCQSTAKEKVQSFEDFLNNK